MLFANMITLGKDRDDLQTVHIFWKHTVEKWSLEVNIKKKKKKR